MAAADEVVLYTKAENNANLVTPDIGAFSGTITGTINHESAKFNNGARPGNVISGLGYGRSNVAPNPNRYVLDFWTKWKKASTSWNTFEWFLGDRRSGVYHGLLLGMLNTGEIRVVLKDTAGDDGYSSAVLTFAANDIDHFVVIVDANATFDGAKTWAVYRNKVELFSGNKVFNFTVLNPNYAFLAAIAAGGGVYQQSCVNVVIDDILVYNENAIPFLSDIVDNDNEGPPVIAGGFGLLDGSIHSPLLSGGLM